MDRDIIIGWILIFFIVFIMALGVYERITAGFESKTEKIDKIYKHLGDKLTFRELKKRCPECTNVDYYHVTRKL